jgi:hypothetical protein
MDAEDKERESGRLVFGDDVLAYYRHGLAWEVPIAKLVAIGEYTNGNGPWLEDYFFVFVEAGGSYRQASFYAIGAAQALAELGRALHAELAAGLCHSTEWKTRIMWPERVRDQPLFDVHRTATERVGFWKRLRHRVFGPEETTVLSEAVMALSQGAV